jgi:hypothetical protein
MTAGKTASTLYLFAAATVSFATFMVLHLTTDWPKTIIGLATLGLLGAGLARVGVDHHIGVEFRGIKRSARLFATLRATRSEPTTQRRPSDVGRRLGTDLHHGDHHRAQHGPASSADSGDPDSDDTDPPSRPRLLPTPAAVAPAVVHLVAA